MAKLTIMELTKDSRFFGKSEYAMFDCLTEDNQIIPCGITYNALESKQYSTDDLESLIGFSITTKEYEDRETGEIMNPEDRIEDIVSETFELGKVVLFNSINCRIKPSELYKIERRESKAQTDAYLKKLSVEDKKRKALQASQERLLARVAGLSTKPASETLELSDDEKIVPVEAEALPELEVVDTTTSDEPPF